MVIIQHEEPLAPYDVSTVDCTVDIVSSTTGRAAVLDHGDPLP